MRPSGSRVRRTTIRAVVPRARDTPAYRQRTVSPPAALTSPAESPAPPSAPATSVPASAAGKNARKTNSGVQIRQPRRTVPPPEQAASGISLWSVRTMREARCRVDQHLSVFLQRLRVAAHLDGRRFVVSTGHIVRNLFRCVGSSFVSRGAGSPPDHTGACVLSCRPHFEVCARGEIR